MELYATSLHPALTIYIILERDNDGTSPLPEWLNKQPHL